MSIEKNNVIWILPCKSQEFALGPKVFLDPITVVLEYDYETPTGEYAWSKVRFLGVQGFLFTTYRSCQPEQIEAYDKIVTVTPSIWLRELKLSGKEVSSPFMHYRMFLDEIGCYEVIAESIELPPG